MKTIVTTYKTQYLLTLASGGSMVVYLQKVGARYFWVNNDYELAVAIEDADIINAVPLD